MPATDLHLFQFGDHHNELWTTHELMHGVPSCAPWITDYVWTPDTVTGSESGRLARVWRHRDTMQ